MESNFPGNFSHGSLELEGIFFRKFSSRESTIGSSLREFRIIEGREIGGKITVLE